MDQLIAVGENLIQMKSSNDMQKLEGLSDASSDTKSDPTHNLGSSNHEATHHIRYGMMFVICPFLSNSSFWLR